MQGHLSYLEMMFFMASHHLLTLLHKGSLLFLVFFFEYFFPFKDGIQINFLILVYLFEQIDFKIPLFDFYFIYDEFANQRHLHPIFLHFFHYFHVSHSNSLFNHILFSSFHYCLFLIIRLVIGPAVVIHITTKLLVLKIILWLTAFFFEIFLLYCFFSFSKIIINAKIFLTTTLNHDHFCYLLSIFINKKEEVLYSKYYEVDL